MNAALFSLVDRSALRVSMYVSAMEGLTCACEAYRKLAEKKCTKSFLVNAVDQIQLLTARTCRMSMWSGHFNDKTASMDVHLYSIMVLELTCRFVRLRNDSVTLSPAAAALHHNHQRSDTATELFVRNSWRSLDVFVRLLLKHVGLEHSIEHLIEHLSEHSSEHSSEQSTERSADAFMCTISTTHSPTFQLKATRASASTDATATMRDGVVTDFFENRESLADSDCAAKTQCRYERYYTDWASEISTLLIEACAADSVDR
jgi:hypothetical protein